MPYSALTDSDRAAMLEAIGATSVTQLFSDIPPKLRAKAATAFESAYLGAPHAEWDLKREFSRLAAKNQNSETDVSFLGAGLYDHFVPAVVPALAARGEFLTAYTPYQAETSQGTLQVIYEFQSLICRLTEMEIANASLYDGATALAEAIIVTASVTKKSRILIPKNLSPAFSRVAKTYVQGLPISLETISFERDTGLLDVSELRDELAKGDVSCVVLAQPNFFGGLEDATQISALTHEFGALLVTVFNPLSLGILPAPGTFETDIAVGEGQSLGLPLSFGGPGLGLFCCAQKFARFAPGRLVGLTTDGQGKRGFTLTMQTREQHIRREKATSNICSNQALCALISTIFLSTLGETGLREAASQCFHKTAFLRDKLKQIGLQPRFSSPHFHEFAVELPLPISKVNAQLRDRGIIGPYDLSGSFPDLQNVALFCCTEKRSRLQIEALSDALFEICNL